MAEQSTGLEDVITSMKGARWELITTGSRQRPRGKNRVRGNLFPSFHHTPSSLTIIVGRTWSDETGSAFPGELWSHFQLWRMKQNSPYFTVSFGFPRYTVLTFNPHPCYTLWTNHQHVTGSPSIALSYLESFSWLDHHPHRSLAIQTSSASNGCGHIPQEWPLVRCQQFREGDLMIFGESLKYSASTLHTCALLYSADIWTTFSMYDTLCWTRLVPFLTQLILSDVRPIRRSPWYSSYLAREAALALSGATSCLLLLHIIIPSLQPRVIIANSVHQRCPYPSPQMDSPIGSLSKEVTGWVSMPFPNLCSQYICSSHPSPRPHVCPFLWFLQRSGVYDIILWTIHVSWKMSLAYVSLLLKPERSGVHSAVAPKVALSLSLLGFPTFFGRVSFLKSLHC